MFFRRGSLSKGRQHTEGTATTIISSGFLCSISPSEPNGPLGTGSMTCPVKLASTTEAVSCIWYPDLRSQVCAPSGAGIIYSEIVRTGTQTRYAPLSESDIFSSLFPQRCAYRPILGQRTVPCPKKASPAADIHCLQQGKLFVFNSIQ